MLGQITKALQKMVAEKEQTESRLNSVFQLVDQGFSEAQPEAQEIVNGAQARFDTMTATVQAVAAEVMNRMEAINKEVEALKAAATSPRPEPRSEPSRSRPEAPPPPFSWTGGPPDSSTGGPPPTPGAPQSSTDAPRSQYPQQEPMRNVTQFGGSAPLYAGPYGSNGQRPGFNAFVHPGQPSHPSDPTSSKIPHYNMSSPGNPLNGSLPQWAPGAGN